MTDNGRGAVNRDAAIEAGLSAWVDEGGEMDADTATVISAILDAAAPHLKAEALRDAASAYQVDGWADDLPRGTDRLTLILGMAQRAVDFLRARADRIEQNQR